MSAPSEADPATTASDAARLRAFLDLIQSNQGWQKSRSEPLAQCKFCLLEIVIMMKADLQTIQYVYRKNRMALTKELISNGCRYHPDLDVVNFLVHPYKTQVETDIAWLRELLEVQAWQNCFAASAASYAYSPLEIALILKADLPTIQQIYQMHSEALEVHVIHNLCYHGGQQGVLGFLAEKLPEAISQPCRSGCSRSGQLPLGLPLGQLPLHLILKEHPCRFSEMDISKLVEIYPESVNVQYEGYGLMNQKPWEVALERQFGSNLLGSILQYTSFPGKALEIRNASVTPWRALGGPTRSTIDVACVKGLSRVLSRIDSFTSTHYKWEVEAFLEWFHLTLKTPNITHLSIRADIVIEENDASLMDGKLDTALLEPHLKLAPKCGIRFLSLTCSMRHKDPICPEMLGRIILAIPHLERLNLENWQGSNNAVSALCQLLETSCTLRALHLTWASSEDKNKNRVSCMLDALARNSYLKEFSFRQLGAHGQAVATYQQHLLEILATTNATLEQASVAGRGQGPDDEKIHYFTRLNQCGRAAARDPSTKLVDFVNLLISAQANGWLQVDEDDSSLEVINVLHGLLRESPTVWSSQFSSVGCTRKRKRQLVSVS